VRFQQDERPEQRAFFIASMKSGAYKRLEVRFGMG